MHRAELPDELAATAARADAATAELIARAWATGDRGALRAGRRKAADAVVRAVVDVAVVQLDRLLDAEPPEAPLFDLADVAGPCERLCAVCQAPLCDHRPDAVTCSTTCRVRLHRRRLDEPELLDAERARPPAKLDMPPAPRENHR